ncbi:MAG: hypothetical protein AAFR64_12540 [Pseudomonadota bacterium]
MSSLPDTFYEDRALRDAAKTVLLADIEYARTSLSGKAVAGRVVGRIGDGAKDVFEVAKDQADGKRGLIAGLIAIVALWFARRPLLEMFGFVSDQLEEALEEAVLDAQEADESEPSPAQPPENEFETADAAPAPADPTPVTTGESDD